MCKGAGWHLPDLLPQSLLPTNSTQLGHSGNQAQRIGRNSYIFSSSFIRIFLPSLFHSRLMDNNLVAGVNSPPWASTCVHVAHQSSTETHAGLLSCPLPFPPPCSVPQPFQTCSPTLNMIPWARGAILDFKQRNDFERLLWKGNSPEPGGRKTG